MCEEKMSYEDFQVWLKKEVEKAVRLRASNNSPISIFDSLSKLDLEDEDTARCLYYIYMRDEYEPSPFIIENDTKEG